MDGRQSAVLRLFLLQAICNAATISGTLLGFLGKQRWAVVLAGAAFLATLIVQYLLYRTSTKTTYHEFEDGREKRFVDFFCNWYDRNGTHNC
jgi:Flp pilus assembly protein TadB